MGIFRKEPSRKEWKDSRGFGGGWVEGELKREAGPGVGTLRLSENKLEMAHGPGRDRVTGTQF